jgi:anti-anti-sigma factor
MAVVFHPDEVFDLAFAVRSEEKNGSAELWLSGELDLAGVTVFEQELQRLQRRGYDVAAIDLADLVFIDVVGLHALVAARERSGGIQPPPALRGATPPVTRVFELLDLDQHLAEPR